ncbi:MAG: hypothetical protein IPL78_13520 [Chloroflexi bacterium]|nr:hypothetical protein [Chloroflexota bacterium]
MTEQTTFFSLLRTHFSPDELKTLCFTLGVDYDDLDTSRKSSLARELVEHCHRRGQLPQLEATIRQQRPDILWPNPGDPTTPDPLNHHFQGLIQLLSSDRYQLDSRFVQLTLLIDRGPDAQWQNHPAPPPATGSRLARTGNPGFLAACWGGPPPSSSAPTAPPTPPHFAFAPLNAYRGDKPGDPPPSPFAWLAREWQNRHSGVADFNTIFRQGRLILLLDGLNEIPHRDKSDYQERVGEWQAFLPNAHCGNTVSLVAATWVPGGAGEAVPVRRVQVEP